MTEHEHEHTHTYTHSHDHEHEHGEHAHEHEHTYTHSHPHVHDGEEGHTHVHPEEDAAHHHHDHPHEHPHSHEHTGKPAEELVALMKYMAGHNASHTRELEGLAGEVKASGHEESYEKIMEAVRFFDQGNEVLKEALDKFLAE